MFARHKLPSFFALDRPYRAYYWYHYWNKQCTSDMFIGTWMIYIPYTCVLLSIRHEDPFAQGMSSVHHHAMLLLTDFQTYSDEITYSIQLYAHSENSPGYYLAEWPVCALGQMHALKQVTDGHLVKCPHLLTTWSSAIQNFFDLEWNKWELLFDQVPGTRYFDHWQDKMG